MSSICRYLLFRRFRVCKGFMRISRFDGYYDYKHKSRDTMTIITGSSDAHVEQIPTVPCQ